LLKHDGNGPSTSELEHVGHPSVDALGGMRNLLVESFALAIDGVTVMLLIRPVDSDEQSGSAATLSGGVVHDWMA
jgi:hypothetical protein